MVKKLALLTQLVVYKDIIPGYRIRNLSDKEKSAKVRITNEFFDIFNILLSKLII